MSIVKITNKQNLDELVAKITLKLGRKTTHQEILDQCVKLGQDHFEELIQRINSFSVFDDKKLHKIMVMRKKLAKIKWYPLNKNNFINQDDADISNFL